ncbi:unnamed protein product [Hymenolepis diminuta]|uniref:Uncharacterized protein n=1 Tax=Hymenolepis diminuta TaxID=6216 RepID=A0A564YKK8_HYMDI|nr:unnamed protein product [Hymenolepis diminuta]
MKRSITRFVVAFLSGWERQWRDSKIWQRKGLKTKGLGIPVETSKGIKQEAVSSETSFKWREIGRFQNSWSLESVFRASARR